jgi:diguanylate cyclase (GGDEF)-like protein
VPSEGRLDDVVLSILSCTRSESYRGIITALVAAAVRYGSYDRAFFARWNEAGSALILRSKADSSSRRLTRHRVPVVEAEAALLRDAQTSERPVLLRAFLSAPGGVLGNLSTDEVLAVPLNREFATPSFLMLDRSLTLSPIGIEQGDQTLATMLGMTGSLLIQNLLLRRRRQRAQKFALTDPLTRLFNRRMGILALEQAMARTDRDQRPLTVLMCDLDHFKRLNDTLGHLQGDAALQATADVLRYSVRRSDTVCRFGGEEFLVVLPETTPDEATVLATRMFTAVHARGEELGLPITVSIGLTSHRPGDTVESLLYRADRALYASKGHGRNRFSADIDGLDDVPVEASPPADPGGL